MATSAAVLDRVEEVGGHPAPAASAVRFEHVSKVFRTPAGGAFSALDDVDLTVEHGDVFGIVGYSGAGKSTLLRTVNALERPTSGRVVVRGEDVSALTGPALHRARQRIGMVFQRFNLLASRNVYRNIAYPLALAKRPKADIVDRVEELLDFVGLTDKALQYPARLSGGQQQRVGIARALATAPDILICDEATSALDPQTTGEVLDLLRRVNRELGVTILLVTHEMDVVRELANRVAVMEDGRVIETGNVYDVFSAPQTPTAQRFVSSVLRHVPSPETLDGIRRRHPGRLIRVHVSDAASNEPFLSRIARDTGADVTLVHGGVDELQGRLFGTFTIELTGSDAQVDHAVAALRTIADITEVPHA